MANTQSRGQKQSDGKPLMQTHQILYKGRELNRRSVMIEVSLKLERWQGMTLVPLQLANTKQANS